MKLVDLMLALALWSVCIPAFAGQYIAIRRSYDETTARLEALSNARETVNAFMVCHQKKLAYPRVEGYTVTGETLQFVWKGKVMSYELR